MNRLSIYKSQVPLILFQFRKFLVFLSSVFLRNNSIGGISITINSIKELGVYIHNRMLFKVLCGLLTFFTKTWFLTSELRGHKKTVKEVLNLETSSPFSTKNWRTETET